MLNFCNHQAHIAVSQHGMYVLHSFKSNSRDVDTNLACKIFLRQENKRQV